MREAPLSESRKRNIDESAKRQACGSVLTERFLRGVRQVQEAVIVFVGLVQFSHVAAHAHYTVVLRHEIHGFRRAESHALPAMFRENKYSGLAIHLCCSLPDDHAELGHGETVRNHELSLAQHR